MPALSLLWGQQAVFWGSEVSGRLEVERGWKSLLWANEGGSHVVVGGIRNAGPARVWEVGGLVWLCVTEGHPVEVCVLDFWIGPFFWD